jgi:hypothetical protein
MLGTIPVQLPLIEILHGAGESDRQQILACRARRVIWLSILDYGDCLARAETGGSLDLLAQAFRRTREQHPALVVVADLEYLGRRFLASHISFA